MNSTAIDFGPQVGEAAPNFDLAAHPMGRVKLADFHGKRNVILAFYPKDDTPGCTREMCAFSTDREQFARLDTAIFGVSFDDTNRHADFAEKHNLTIPLLADIGGKAASAYGASRPGAKYADRVLFIIDKQGIIRHIHHGMPTNLTLLHALEEIRVTR